MRKVGGSLPPTSPIALSQMRSPTGTTSVVTILAVGSATHRLTI